MEIPLPMALHMSSQRLPRPEPLRTQRALVHPHPRRHPPPPFPPPATIRSRALAVLHRLLAAAVIGGGGWGGESEEEAGDIALLGLRLVVGASWLGAPPAPLSREGPRDERWKWGLGLGHVKAEWLRRRRKGEKRVSTFRLNGVVWFMRERSGG